MSFFRKKERIPLEGRIDWRIILYNWGRAKKPHTELAFRENITLIFSLNVGSTARGLTKPASLRRGFLWGNDMADKKGGTTPIVPAEKKQEFSDLRNDYLSQGYTPRDASRDAARQVTKK